jgi:hypothetical protein
MADFCTVEDVASLIQVAIPADKLASCERAIREASEVIRNYCKQTIEQTTGDVITLDCPEGRTRIFLPQLPVVSVASVVEDGETLTAGTEYQLGQYGILYRIGQCWKAGIQILTVTYSHGYATIPDDVIGVCTRAAARIYQAGLRAAETSGVPGVSGKQLGDFSVSYSGEQGGGAGDGGVMGVSAARMLLLSEKDILDNYRYTGA